MERSLAILKEKQKDLLLAEAVGLLHNYYKCSDSHLYSNTVGDEKDKSNPPPGVKKSFLEENFKERDIKINLFFKEGLSVYELLKIHNEFGTVYEKLRDKNEEKKKKWIEGNKELYNLYNRIHDSWEVTLLHKCHLRAHIEKELENNNLPPECKQKFKVGIKLANPFGYEETSLENLDKKLAQIPLDLLNNLTSKDIYHQFRKEVKRIFKQAPGDTRRPLNEVSLWDWSSVVAAMYKAGLAQCLLIDEIPEIKTKEDEKKVKWRLLSLRFDGSKLLDTSPKVAHLLARRQWLKVGLNKIRDLLEFEYPLGTEVYRDNDGIIFVVPDLPDLLQYKDGEKSLKKLIEERIAEAFAGELTIKPELDKDEEAWWGQDPNFDSKKPMDNPDNKLPPIVDRLEKYYPANANFSIMQGWWQKTSGVEPCRVSGVRPQSKDKDKDNRKISDYWWEKVRGRAKHWRENPVDTIWMSEVADINGRVALIAANLQINKWLKGDLVRTFFYDQPIAKEQVYQSMLPKNPSFARLRRIWETGQGFWPNIIQESLEEVTGQVEFRLEIQGQYDDTNWLERYKAYDLLLKPGLKMQVMWDGKEFVVIDNLCYLAKRLGAEKEKWINLKSAAEFITKNYLQSKKELALQEPGDSLEQGRKILELSDIEVVGYGSNRPYYPYISLLEEPQQLLLLVPADKALAAAIKIREEYEKKFSKVKNRLPLHLNLIFFNRRQPLYTVLDSARKMLRRESDIHTIWQVEERKKLEGKVHELYLKREEENLNYKLITKIDCATADSEIQDNWYPYFFLEEGESEIKREQCFQGKTSDRRDIKLIHVSQLQAGDRIHYSPSTFDFQFLDTSSRRFELVYQKGMRLPRENEYYSTLPFLLEDINLIQNLWQKVIKSKNSPLTTSQVKQISEFIQEKRETWKIEKAEDPVLEEIVEQAFRRAFAKEWEKISQENRETLVEWGTSGRWNDLLELYMNILKDRPEKGVDGQEGKK